MNTFQKLIKGERFSIKGRQGVFRVDVDPEVGIMGVVRYHEADAPPSHQGLASIEECQLTCETHLLGTLVSTRVALVDIDFERLSYDDDLPF